MSIRLFDSAWVRIDDPDQSVVQVIKDKRNPGLFDVAGNKYDIDGRASLQNPAAPALIRVLSLSEVKSAGLSSGYDRDLPRDASDRSR